MTLKTAAKIGVKTVGDAFLVRFKSAVGAVRAGMDIQNEFLEYNKDKKKADQILMVS